MNTDVQSFGQTVGNIIGGRNSPIPAKNVISNVLYKALTSGSIQVTEFNLKKFFKISQIN